MKTLDANKLIVEFMGATLYADTPEGKWYNGIEPYPHPMHESAIEHHTSWDWLMPVVEKIENLNLGTIEADYIPGCASELINANVQFRISYNETTIDLFGDMDVWEGWMSFTKFKTKMESVYNAVVEFIKWYNDRNSPNAVNPDKK